jgi:hypothetical protein
MECPKCRKTVGESDYDCPYCGTKIKSAPKKKSKGKLKKLAEKKQTKKHASPRKGDNLSPENVKTGLDLAGKLKYVALGFCILLVVIIAVAVLSSAFSSKGEKYAELAAEYIGSDFKSLKNADGVNFKDESDYFGVNSAMKFDYIFESDGKLKANDISFPEWAVTVDVDSSNYVTDVTYTNFKMIKKDMRGSKHDSLVTLDTFKAGDKQSAVTKYIDMEPYSISYAQSGIVTYTYKYYYTRDNGDAQQVILRASFTEEGKYKYYTSELVFPDNL